MDNQRVKGENTMSSSHTFYSVDKITLTSKILVSDEGEEFTILKITIRDSRDYVSRVDLLVNDDIECKVNMEGSTAINLTNLLESCK